MSQSFAFPTTLYLVPGALQALSDVSVNPGSGQNGYPLVWNNTTGKWEAGTNATNDTAARANLKIPEYTISRGQNLVSNGFATMGTNYNFSSFTFNGSETYFSGGSFTNTTTGSHRFSDEFIPVDITKKYILQYALRQTNNAYFFCGLAFFDIDFNDIVSHTHMKIAGTDTELAQELKPGDTTIVIKNPANWLGNTGSSDARSIIFWNYTNSYGGTYPLATNPYSRFQYLNIWNPQTISVDPQTGYGTIQLKSPWPPATGVFPPNQTFPANTPCSNNNSGPGYKYITVGPSLSNQVIPTTFTVFSGVISGPPDLTGGNVLNRFPPGTAYCKLQFYRNESTTLFVSSVSFTEDYTSLSRYTPTSDADSTNTTSGSIVTPGGVGIAKSLIVGGSKVNFANLPTSGDSIAVGDLWRDGNVIKVKT